MNDFASTTNSGLLKVDYEPEPKGDTALYKMLRKKRQRMADNRLGIKDQFPREVEESEKSEFGEVKS